MVDTRKIDIVEKFAKSGAAAFALRQELKRRDDLGLGDPSEDEIIKVVEEAERRNVFGVDYKTDRRGEPIPQGIGSPGHESINHFNSIRRYEGQAAWEREVRAMWKRNPDRARKIGLPELPRVGA